MPSTLEQPKPSDALGAFLTVRSEHTVTALYPGLIVPEQGPEREVWETTFDGGPLRRILALAPHDDRWYGLVVTHTVYRGDPHGGRRVVHVATMAVYVGEVMTTEQVEAMPDDRRPRIVVENMISNGWDKVVHTRADTWHMLRPDDAVFSTADLLALVTA